MTTTGENDSRPAPRFAVIGAGMSGILSAIRLQEAGLTDFTVYEKAASLGGTWRENRYPGLACDVPSHLYSYSFEPNPDWTHRYAPGPEIRAYFERVAEKYDVVKYIRFGDGVAACAYDDGRWRVTTQAGHVDEVDFVIAATGVLHHPNIPAFAGMDTFRGEMFHSARWPDGLSLAGRRVGVIGTGSTGVQIVSAVVDEVSELSLFQRTAQWILPQDNVAYTEEEKRRFREHPETMRTLHGELLEGFSNNFANAVIDSESPAMKMVEQLCLQNLEEHVRDPALKEKLRPTYRAACKRLVVSPDFYDAIQKPNAHLVTEAIERFEPAGVRTVDGTLHELDVLVLATGFDATAFMRPMDIRGVGGVTLDDAWAERPSAYLSITIPGFPNFFMLNGPNGPVGNFSLIEVAELQFGYIMQLVAAVRAGEHRALSVRADVEEAFEASRVEAARNTIWTTGCKSWYLDDRGIPASWPWTFRRFQQEMAAPDMDAYEFLAPAR